MEFLIFIIGFVIGAAAVYIPLFLNRKNEQSAKDAMIEQMKLSFESTANALLKDGSKELSEQNREKMDEFYKRFKERIEDFEKRAEESLKQRNLPVLI